MMEGFSKSNHILQEILSTPFPLMTYAAPKLAWISFAFLHNKQLTRHLQITFAYTAISYEFKWQWKSHILTPTVYFRILTNLGINKGNCAGDPVLAREWFHELIRRGEQRELLWFC